MTLRLRLILSHLAVIIAAMGLSGLLLLSFVEQYFLQATEDSLIAQARLTVQALLPGNLASGPEINVQAPLSNTLSQQNNLYVQTDQPNNWSSVQLGAQLTTHILILDNTGKVRVDSESAQVGENIREVEVVQQAFETGEVASKIQENTMALALPVKEGATLTGMVYLTQPLTDVIAVLNDIRGKWILSTGIGVVLSAVMGFILSQMISKPLGRLTEAVEAVAGGNFDQKVDLKSRDELGRLSGAFNEMTDRLRVSRQIQTDFVANVSHELRTPLTSIKTIIETLRGGAADDPDAREMFMETVESETNRLIRLVNDLLLLTRADSHVLNLQCEIINLNHLVKNVLMTIQAPVCFQIAEDVTIKADLDRTAQVLINVLDNAAKYSQGKVNVSAESNGPQTVLIKVCDDGQGIAASDLPRIGQRFYRTDKARSRQHGGSGLGLAIAMALVEAQGGKLWLESKEGQGTTVNFTLPAG